MKINFKDSISKFKKLFIKEGEVLLVLGFTLTVLLVWLRAFYPGVMTYDSVYQWNQALEFQKWDNFVPYLHTLLIATTQRIWETPAAINLVHTALISLIIAFIYRELKLLKIKIHFRILFVALTLIQPTLLIYNITLWKDVMYTYLLFLQIPIFLYYYRTKKKLSLKSIVIIAFLTAFAVSMRHNGIPYLAVIPFCYWVLQTVNIKKGALLLFTTVFIYFVLQFIVIIPFPASNERLPYLERFHRIHLIGALLNEDVEFTQKQKDVITEFIPDLDLAKEAYTCVHANWIFIEPVTTEEVFRKSKNLKAFDQTTTELFIKNPGVVLKDRLCMFGNIMSYKEGSNYLYSADIYPNDNGIVQYRKSYTDNFEDYLKFTSEFPIRTIFWFHGLTSVVYILGMMVALLKKDRLVIAISTMLLINLPLFFLLNVSNDFRYLFILQLAFPLYLAIILSRINIKPILKKVKS